MKHNLRQLPSGIRFHYLMHALIVVAVGATVFGQTIVSPPRIIVGPNVLVSGHSTGPHVEPMLAALVTPVQGQPTLLLGASFGEVYRSVDGGSTWSTLAVSALGMGTEEGVAWMDPQVAFDGQGRGYVIAVDEDGDNLLSRSRDLNLLSWEPAKKIVKGDHPQLLIDASTGKYSGRMYISLFGNQFYRSEDGGITFIGPMQAGGAEVGFDNTNSLNLAMFRDGSIFIPYRQWSSSSFRDSYSRDQNWTFGVAFVTSADGGVSFSKPIHAFDVVLPSFDAILRGRREGKLAFFEEAPQFALDSSGGPFTDRIYAVWRDFRSGRARLFFSTSTDRGATWSLPRQLDSNVPNESEQFQPAIVVNNEGAIGVQWFDTRPSDAGDSFNVYFSASSDGGHTFASPVRVSSRTSFPIRPGNFKFSAIEGGGGVYPLIYRYGNGGDYMGLASDIHGCFHPLWTDSRDGIYEIYTSSIKVTRQTKDSQPNPELREAGVNDLVRLESDPSQYDQVKKELILRVRVLNTSSKTIYPAIHVQITKGERGPLCIFSNSAKNNDTAANRAYFDYSKALGGLDVLPPGGITEAIEWRLPFGDGSVPEGKWCGTNITGYLPK